MKAALLVAFIAMIATANPAISCQTDKDCRTGKKCVSAPGQTLGVCVEGELDELVETNEGKDGTPQKQAAKNPCEFDRQCDPNEYCFRPEIESYGICVRH